MLKMIVHSIPLLNIIKDLIKFAASTSLSLEQMEEFLDEGMTEVFIDSILNQVISSFRTLNVLPEKRA